jgi:hypothetical protein
MKKPVLLSLIAAAMIMAGCANFPTQYTRIEPEKARLLDFIYEPTEAAPGDTVLLRAIFAGRVVASDELTWSMSQKIMVNEYGTVTALDTVPLDIIPESCSFSDRTSCIAFRFVVPPRIIAESPLAPENIVDALPSYYRSYMPEELKSVTKSSLMAMVDMMASVTDPSMLPVDTAAMALLPVLLQCYTVPMRIYCTIAGDHTILSGYSVRYNSRFASLPAFNIPVNRNPRIDSIGIYKVHASPLTTFNPSSPAHNYEFIPVADTGVTPVVIDKGYTYFMSVATGIVDSTLSIDAAMGNGTPLPEQHLVLWYVEFDKDEMDEVSPYDLPDIGGDDFSGGKHQSTIAPSRDVRISGCTAWVKVTDQFLNEYYRPQGSALREVRLSFTYTDAYRTSLRK